MKGRLSAIGVVCLCGIVAWTLNGLMQRSAADDKPPHPQASPVEKSERDRWMAVKLASGQEILKYLTNADFEQLEVSARRMQVLNLLEQWLREEGSSRKSEYQGQLNAFEFANKELIRHAGDKNIDGALKAYIALTESCVHCHKLIRDVPKG